MFLFLPSFIFKRLTDINLFFLRENNIDLILLDVDNTMAAHGSQEPFEGVVEWTKEVLDSGVSIVIVSNNFKSRVEPFAKKFNLPCVSLSLKPSPFGFNRAKKMLKIKPKNILVVGDQIFTDVLGANLAGMKSVLLEPAMKEKELNIRFKRILETPIRKRLNKRNLK